MRFAYADPPYPGQAKRHYKHDPNRPAVVGEIDHIQLAQRLMDEFPDGWALSTSANTRARDYVETSCKRVLGEQYHDLRLMVWTKPFCSFKPGVNPAYAWEPVYVWGGRKRTRQQPTIRDWVSANITLKKGTHGAKPPQFYQWLFQVLNVEPDDELHDLFPGTGSLAAVLNDWRTLQYIL